MEPIRGKNEINDPSYRYKMHKLNFQRERTKTCITNLNIIAEDLKIPDQDLIVSYFKKRLAIAITGKDDRVIITNDVSTPSIQTALYEFIEYFVLCKFADILSSPIHWTKNIYRCGVKVVEKSIQLNPINIQKK